MFLLKLKPNLIQVWYESELWVGLSQVVQGWISNFASKWNIYKLNYS